MKLAYGKRHVSLPRDLRPAAVLEPQKVKPVSDVGAAVRESLDSPVESPALCQLLSGRRSCLILTVDFTRPSPRELLLPILDACDEAEVNATICIAGGRHRTMTRTELTEHLGKDILGRAPVVCHDSFDDSAHDDFGETRRGTPVRLNRILTEHDLVIGVGFIEPTYLAGFSSGRKLVLPGVAHHEAVDANHYLLLEKGALPGVLEGNPLCEDMEEAARLAPFHWLTAAVVGPDDETVAVVSGDPHEAHREGCKTSGEIFTCARTEGDLIISSVGGHPYDVDLVQGKKAVVPATEVVAPGGTIIALAACPEVWGAEKVFRDWVTRYTPQEVVEKVHDRDLFSLGAHGANVLAKPIVNRDARLILVCSKPMRDALDGSFVETAASLQGALKRVPQAARGRVVVLRKARRLIIDEAR